MKRTPSIILPLVFILIAAGCSRDRVSTSFGGVFEKLKKARGFSEARECYTGGTIDAVFRVANPALRMRPGMRVEFNIVKQGPKKTVVKED